MTIWRGSSASLGSTCTAVGTAAALLGGSTALLSSQGQATDWRAAVEGTLMLTTEPTPEARVFRRLDDVGTGSRWLLIYDAQHPGGPGQWVAANDRKPYQARHISDGPVIRPGDKLIVEEHSRTAEAYLEAVAQSPAAVGQGLDVRLKIGGKVVRAVALAPGKAALAPQAGVRP